MELPAQAATNAGLEHPPAPLAARVEGPWLDNTRGVEHCSADNLPAQWEGVSTPVSIALDGDRAYFVTAADSGKAKRLARNASVRLAACTASGKVVGETVGGRARLLEGQERKNVRWLLRPTRSLFWSFLLYRLRGKSMNAYEIVPSSS